MPKQWWSFDYSLRCFDCCGAWLLPPCNAAATILLVVFAGFRCKTFVRLSYLLNILFFQRASLSVSFSTDCFQQNSKRPVRRWSQPPCPINKKSDTGPVFVARSLWLFADRRWLSQFAIVLPVNSSWALRLESNPCTRHRQWNVRHPEKNCGVWKLPRWWRAIAVHNVPRLSMLLSGMENWLWYPGRCSFRPKR